MAATFSRRKVWGAERLTYSDLDAEFDNILSHLDVTGLGGDSADLTTMQQTVAPAPYASGVQVESLATAIGGVPGGELERLRYMLKQITGGTYWYTDPARTLNAQPGDMVIALPFLGSNVNLAFSDTISRGAIINPVSLASADFAAGNISTSTTKFGNPSLTLGASKFLAYPGRIYSTGTFSAQFRNLSANDYIAFNPVLGIELFLDSSGYLTAKVTQSKPALETTKTVTTIADVTTSASLSAFHSAIFQWNFNNGAAADSAALFLDGANKGSPVVAGTIPMNPGAGGVWHFGAKRNDPTLGTSNGWDHYSSMKVKPESEATNAWTYSGTATTSVASNSLNISAPTNEQGLYSNTANTPDITQFTAETKARFTASTADFQTGLFQQYAELFYIFDNTAHRTIAIDIYRGKIIIHNVATGANAEFRLNTDDYHVYRVTSSGSPSPTTNFYVDGILVYTYTNAVVAGAVTTRIQFGVDTQTYNTGIVCDFEYYAYYTGAVKAPLAADSTGSLADISGYTSYLPTNVITQLVNNEARKVFGRDLKWGPTLPQTLAIYKTPGSMAQVTGQAELAILFFPSDGVTPIGYNFAGTATSNTASTALTIAEDSRTAGVVVDYIDVGNASNIMACMTGKRVFKAGLRSLALYYSDGANSGTNKAIGNLNLFIAGNF